MSQVIFDYRQINPKKPELAYPAADIWFLGKDGHFRLFTLYVDSGAAISVLTASDAMRLGINLAEGEPTDLFGISGSIKAYIHPLEAKIGEINKFVSNEIKFPARVAFSVSDQTPRLLGRADIFFKFLISFRELTQKTYFTEEPVKFIRLIK